MKKIVSPTLLLSFCPSLFFLPTPFFVAAQLFYGLLLPFICMRGKALIPCGVKETAEGTVSLPCRGDGVHCRFGAS